MVCRSPFIIDGGHNPQCIEHGKEISGLPDAEGDSLTACWRNRTLRKCISGEPLVDHLLCTPPIPNAGSKLLAHTRDAEGATGCETGKKVSCSNAFAGGTLVLCFGSVTPSALSMTDEENPGKNPKGRHRRTLRIKNQHGSCKSGLRCGFRHCSLIFPLGKAVRIRAGWDRRISRCCWIALITSVAKKGS